VSVALTFGRPASTSAWSGASCNRASNRRPAAARDGSPRLRFPSARASTSHAILRHLHAVITTDTAWDPLIGTVGIAV
jgi:hypothetical protein